MRASFAVSFVVTLTNIKIPDDCVHLNGNVLKAVNFCPEAGRGRYLGLGYERTVAHDQYTHDSVLRLFLTLQERCKTKESQFLSTQPRDLGLRKIPNSLSSLDATHDDCSHY